MVGTILCDCTKGFYRLLIMDYTPFNHSLIYFTYILVFNSPYITFIANAQLQIKYIIRDI